ncbi:MAG: ribose-phosphate diphosphokinase [Chloroflexota bacterium]
MNRRRYVTVNGSTEVDCKAFITPEQYLREHAERIESPRGPLLVASCRSGSGLGAKVVERYRELLSASGVGRRVPHLDQIDFQFSDGETCVRLDSDVSGHDVFLLQALYDPLSGRSVDQNYMALLIAARALREWGASRVTGILPYLAYARQDKPTKLEREPTTAELMADLSIEAGLDRVVVWHPHTGSTRGFYGSVPVDSLSPLPMVVSNYRRYANEDEVIAVAPDTGASKLVMRVARALGISSAISSKYRPRPEEAEVSEIMGDFRGKRAAIILDDMINTGGTVEATSIKLVEETDIRELYIAVSHNLCSAQALERLSCLHEDYGLREVMITDSIPQAQGFRDLPFLKIHSLADSLARVVNRIHYNRPVSGTLARTAPEKEG